MPVENKIVITMTQEQATSVSGESRRPNLGRKKGWMQRFWVGTFPQRGKSGAFALVGIFIKRVGFGNWYSKKVVDKNTGQILRECEEPFDQHINRGSAKFKDKTE